MHNIHQISVIIPLYNEEQNLLPVLYRELVAVLKNLYNKYSEGYDIVNTRRINTRGLVSWMGFCQAVIDFEAPRRYTGRSKYTFRKMFSTSLDEITAFSSKPLRISFYTGLLISLAGIIYAVFVVINSFRGMNIQG